jgi:hypothetical protein
MNIEHRHDLVIDRPIYGERVRLRNVGTRAAVGFALAGIARFEDEQVQSAVDEISRTFGFHIHEVESGA